MFKIDPEAYEKSPEHTENLIVNLEDIVKEENVIFQIQENLAVKSPIESLCLEWWDNTKDSSVREMELFFEEENSIKLMRHQQIILILALGYVEVMENSIFKNPRILTTIKNILNN